MPAATHPVISVLESKPWLVGRNAVITAQNPGRIVITNFEPEKYARCGEPRTRPDWSVAAALNLEFGNLDGLFSVKTDAAKKTAVVEVKPEAQSKIDAAISRLQELRKNTRIIASPTPAPEFQETVAKTLTRMFEKYLWGKTLLSRGQIVFSIGGENILEISGMERLSSAMALGRNQPMITNIIDTALLDAYGYRGRHLGVLKSEGREPLTGVPPFALRFSKNGKKLIITARRTVAQQILEDITPELLKLRQLRDASFAKTT